MTGAMPPGVKENDIGGTDGGAPDGACCVCHKKSRYMVTCHACDEDLCIHCDQGEGGYGDDGTGVVNLCGRADCEEV